MTIGTNSLTKTFELDEETWLEIKSILAKNGRPDLIQALKDSNDDDYKPPSAKHTKNKRNREYFEYYEGYETDREEYDQSDVTIDGSGFWSLK